MNCCRSCGKEGKHRVSSVGVLVVCSDLGCSNKTSDHYSKVDAEQEWNAQNPVGVRSPPHSGSKYLRTIQLQENRVDVYAVLEAFNVTCPARQHAIKKLLCSGIRDKGDTKQDLNETLDAVKRAIELEAGR